MTTHPEAFGRYRVSRVLGEGAAGSVFVARDDVLGRDVAIKTIKPHVLQFGGSDRFYNEMRAIAGLSHPNVVGVFDVGKQDGVPYLVMEVACGGSLRERLQGGPLPVSEVCALGIQVAHALAAAHARGIVHRDVKPANLLRAGPDTWKLADFGVAHVPDSSATITGQFLGSPAYAAPESLHQGAFGPATDVYGLAATLFEAATGRRPHEDAGYETRLRSSGDDSERFRATLADRVPPTIAVAIVQGLSASPDARPSASRFAEQLAGVAVSSSRPVATPLSMPAIATPRSAIDSKTGPRRSRRRVAALVAVALLVLLLVVLSSGGSDNGSDRAMPPAATTEPTPSILTPTIPTSTPVARPPAIEIPTKTKYKKRERDSDDDKRKKNRHDRERKHDDD